MQVDGLDISDHPFSILKNQKYMNGTNILIGSTSNETFLFLNSLQPGMISTPMFEISLYVKSELIYSLSIFGQDRSVIKQKYLSTEEYNADQKPRLAQITSDAIFSCPIKNSIDEIANVANIYSYFFEASFPGFDNYPFVDLCAGYSCHGSDLAYILHEPFQGNVSPTY